MTIRANLKLVTNWFSNTTVASAVVLLLVSMVPAVSAQSFTDGFENGLSNWTYTGPGTAEISSDYAYMGNHSVQLSTVPAFPWSVSLSHAFGAQETGSVSVYVYSKLDAGASADLAIYPGNGGYANIQQLGTGGFQTRVCASPSSTASLCSNGIFFSGSAMMWHHFEIDVSSSGVTVKLDDTTIVTDPSITTFQSVALDVWGAPSAGSAYYDDFSATIGCQALDPNLVSLNLDPNNPATMSAQFVPKIGGAVVSLVAAAAACGFAGFDWMQTIDQWPGPNETALFAAPHPSVPLVPVFVDPPPGGYTYQVGDPLYPIYQPNFAAANPFYYQCCPN